MVEGATDSCERDDVGRKTGRLLVTSDAGIRALFTRVKLGGRQDVRSYNDEHRYYQPRRGWLKVFTGPMDP